jgi:hypothetical protein
MPNLTYLKSFPIRGWVNNIEIASLVSLVQNKKDKEKEKRHGTS